MKIGKYVCLFVLLVACSGIAVAQMGKSDGPMTVSQIEDHLTGVVEGEFVSTADAMPEDKFSFAPTNGEFKGVRTFAQQVKHVSAVNYIFGAAILGEKPPVDVGSENGPDSMTSKADIMKFTKDSFAYLHKALGSLTEKNETEMVKSPFGDNKMSKLALATIGLWHPMDHYGQMVEYLRMNGIVPPPSRK
jgi:uncharacterized damage-inducible protein DinB